MRSSLSLSLALRRIDSIFAGESAVAVYVAEIYHVVETMSTMSKTERRVASQTSRVQHVVNEVVKGNNSPGQSGELVPASPLANRIAGRKRQAFGSYTT